MNQSRNIVQISVKNMELTKFSISEIKENIKRCEFSNTCLYDGLGSNLYSTFIFGLAFVSVRKPFSS